MATIRYRVRPDKELKLQFAMANVLTLIFPKSLLLSESIRIAQERKPFSELH